MEGHILKCSSNIYNFSNDIVTIPFDHFKEESLYPSCLIYNEKQIPVYFFILDIPSLAKEVGLSKEYSIQMRDKYLITIANLCNDSLNMGYVPAIFERKIEEILAAFPENDPLLDSLKTQTQKLVQELYRTDIPKIERMENIRKLCIMTGKCKVKK